MKIFIIILIIGVAEIFTISTLHQEVGLLNRIYIYLVGTSFGGALLCSGWGEAVSKFKEAAEIDRSWIKRIQSDSKFFKKSTKILIVVA